MNIKFNLKTKIRFNGQEYDSVEAMPPEARQAYEQAISNGRVYTKKKIVFNGKEYGSVDEMPAEQRGLYEQVRGMIDANQNGIPDMLEGGQAPTVGPAIYDTLRESAPIVSQPVAQPKNSTRTLLVVVVGILIFVILAFLLFFIKVGLH
ncbi:MAG TPA: hypothetical protein VMT91_11675 [Anaerolineales bacterium]|nr:hypothetical protein [Anaerolineales bacterium]